MPRLMGRGRRRQTQGQTRALLLVLLVLLLPVLLVQEQGLIQRKTHHQSQSHCLQQGQGERTNRK